MTNPHTKPKVLIVGHDPRAPGGIAAVVRLMLAPELQAHYRLRVAPTARRNTTYQSPLGRLGRSLGSAAGLAAALTRWRPHIIHLHSASHSSFWAIARAAALCRALSPAKRVWHIHGGDFDTFVEGLPPADRHRVTAALSSTDAVIALTERWAQVLRPLAAPSPVRVIPNASEHPCGRPERPTPPPFRVLFVGYVGRDKGVPELLRAAEALAQAGDEGYEYRLIGQPHTEEEGREARRLAERTGAPVTFAGQLPSESLPAEYAAAHVLVLASHWECLPMVLLEAMAAGLPIITTPVGGIPEVLGPGNAVFVAPGDAEGLANALRTLRNDATRRQDMGMRNLQLFQERYTVQRFAQELHTLYQQLLEPNPGSPSA